MKTAAIVSYTETGLRFEDGEEIEADVIIFATGFEGNMRFLVEKLFGAEIAEQMGDFWGLDGEGEVKGAFKGCGRKFQFIFCCWE
jgi:cation diffusion facilitator CzcD-associated flavoprotein CzcO